MKVKAPDGMTSFSHGGIAYQVGANGTADIPDDAFEELKAHGLTRHVPQPELALEAKVTALPSLRKAERR